MQWALSPGCFLSLLPLSGTFNHTGEHSRGPRGHCFPLSILHTPQPGVLSPGCGHPGYFQFLAIENCCQCSWASQVAQTVKNLPAVQESRVRCLAQEDPLEKRMTILSSILAWRIPWTEEPRAIIPRVTKTHTSSGESMCAFPLGRFRGVEPTQGATMCVWLYHG